VTWLRLSALTVPRVHQHNMKLNAAAQAAWNQSSGTSTQSQAQSYQNGTQQAQQSLHAPPGVPPPSSFSQQPTQQGQSQAQTHSTPFVGNGNGNGNGTPTTGNGGNGVVAEAQGQATSNPAPVPQTPAQQILMSAADRWGLLGLLAMIKNADPDQALLSVGTDLGTMGLDMQQQGCAFSFSSSLASYLRSLAGICSQHSSRLGPIRAPHIPSSQTTTSLGATTSSHLLQDQERPQRSVTRRYSSCSTHRRGMRCRKSRHKNCKPTLSAHSLSFFC
jgi:hypothetical protein